MMIGFITDSIEFYHGNKVSFILNKLVAQNRINSQA